MYIVVVGTGNRTLRFHWHPNFEQRHWVDWIPTTRRPAQQHAPPTRCTYKKRRRCRGDLQGPCQGVGGRREMDSLWHSPMPRLSIFLFSRKRHPTDDNFLPHTSSRSRTRTTRHLSIYGTWYLPYEMKQFVRWYMSCDTKLLLENLSIPEAHR